MKHATFGLTSLFALIALCSITSVTSTLRAKAPPGRYVRIANNQVVHDTVTGLEWTAASVGAPVNQETARARCAAHTIGALDDFALPTRDQLITIIDVTARGSDRTPALPNTRNYALDLSVFADAQEGGYWTDTPTIVDYSSFGGVRYWAVGAERGDLFDAQVTEVHPVRCVRVALPGAP